MLVLKVLKLQGWFTAVADEFLSAEKVNRMVRIANAPTE
jgi:hypothetical protein